MKTSVLLLIIFIVLSNKLSVSAEEQKLTIFNTAGLDASTLELVRAHAEKELCIPVVSTNAAIPNPQSLNEIGKQARKTLNLKDSCLIVLGIPTTSSVQHYEIMPGEQTAIINVRALSSTNSVKYLQRLQRLTLRTTAIIFGVGMDLDPHCVMHEYKTLDDLDLLGINFSPPWGAKFRQAAKAHGLQVRPQFQGPRPGMTKVVQPPPPLPKGN